MSAMHRREDSALPARHEVVAIQTRHLEAQQAHVERAHPLQTDFAFEAFEHTFRVELRKNEQLFALGYFEEMLTCEPTSDFFSFCALPQIR